MYVETDRSRNGYRENSERKYDDRFKRRNYRNDNHPYHSSRTSLKSPRHHHHNEDYSSNRIGNKQSSYHTDHSFTSRFDRPTNNRDIYPSLLTDQTILSRGLSPPTDIYYNSSQSIRDRGLPSHYIDSERNRYPQSSSSIYRRESPPAPPPPPPPTSSSSSYRNDIYRSPTPVPIHSSYNDIYRSSDYQNRSERYDVSQSRNCSITSQSSPIYRSDSYQTSSSSYIPRDQYTPVRDYEIPTSTDHYYRSSSYRDRSRTNFNENGSKRPLRR